MDVLQRILDLRIERGWSEYRLSEESGIAQTTISSWFRKQICPTIPSLEKICNAYNITLSQFFNIGNESVTLTPEQAEIVDCWNRLTPAQQQALLEFIRLL